MFHRARLHLLIPALAVGAALAIPAVGLAAGSPSGGATPSGPSGTTTSPSGSSDGSNPLVRPANSPVSASGDGITVSTTASGLFAHQMGFTGTVPASDAGQVVEIERQDSSAAGGWAATAQATATSDGSFKAVWHVNHAGRLAVKAVLLQAAAATDPESGAATGAMTITVYKVSLATIYGPGFFGKQTACGVKLHRATLGVASRSLKCGTSVSILYGGHSIVVPVIDRGPYANGADWDLTSATARALGMTGTADIGAVSVPAH